MDHQVVDISCSYAREALLHPACSLHKKLLQGRQQNSTSLTGRACPVHGASDHQHMLIWSAELCCNALHMHYGSACGATV